MSLQPRHREVDSGTELIGGTGNQNPGVLRQLALGGRGVGKESSEQSKDFRNLPSGRLDSYLILICVYIGQGSPEGWVVS